MSGRTQALRPLPGIEGAQAHEALQLLLQLPLTAQAELFDLAGGLWRLDLHVETAFAGRIYQQDVRGQGPFQAGAYLGPETVAAEVMGGQDHHGSVHRLVKGVVADEQAIPFQDRRDRQPHFIHQLAAGRTQAHHRHVEVTVAVDGHRILLHQRVTFIEFGGSQPVPQALHRPRLSRTQGGVVRDEPLCEGQTAGPACHCHQGQGAKVAAPTPAGVALAFGAVGWRPVAERLRQLDRIRHWVAILKMAPAPGRALPAM